MKTVQMTKKADKLRIIHARGCNAGRTLYALEAATRALHDAHGTKGFV